MMPDPDDKEEGEIEDGEIVESGEEGGVDDGDADNEPKHESHSANLSMMERLYKELEGNGRDGVSLKKKKKKRKKKKKTSAFPIAADREDDDIHPPKAKKARYVDHDRVADGNEKWYKPFPSGPPAEMPGRGAYFGQGQWSPERVSQDENDHLSKHKREKSPPGLYDSPYQSDEEMDDMGGFPAIANVEREAQGGRGGANRQGRRKRMRGGNGGDRKAGGPGGANRDGAKKKKRNQRPLQPSETQHLICKFFLEGKCIKGEGCNYSHDVANKKMELCKFYLNGFCSKIESCIYLHNEFPCKFFHTGAQCYSAENCKFSHEVLTDAMRKALDNHLAKDNKTNNTSKSDEDSGIQQRPRPSLLGSPPQHLKDMVMKKKIPSLLNMEIKPPVYQPGVGGASGPRMAPPQPQGPLLPTPNDFRPGFHEMGGNNDGPRPPLLPLPDSSFETGPLGFYNSFDQDLRHSSFNQMDLRFPNANGPPPAFRHFGSEPNSNMDVDERFPPSTLKNDSDMFMPSEFDEDERVHEVARRSDHDPNNLKDNQPFNPIPWRNLAVSDVDMRSSMLKSDDENSNSDNGKDFYSKSDLEEPFGCGLDRSSSSDGDDEGVKKSALNDIQIPLHLPKKQRELFMRIQQREAAQKTVSDTDESKKSEEHSGPESAVASSGVPGEGQLQDEDDKEEKERWYSSSSDDDDDDNDQPLAAVLKNLQQQPLNASSAPATSNATSVSSLAASDSSMVQLSKILQSFTGKTSAPQVAAPKVDPRRDPRKDPRSRPPPSAAVPAPVVESRDPRSKPRAPSVSVADATQSQPSPTHLSQFSLSSTNTLSYSENGSGYGSICRLSERLGRTSSTSTLSRLSAEPLVKPKPILTRKRSSASEEEMLEESHSKSSFPAIHPIPYKLQLVSVSSPNYSGVINAVNKTADVKLLLSDPRLKKELANDFSVLNNNSNDHLASIGNEKSEMLEDMLAKTSTSQTKVKVGQHRLGVATMPAPRIKTQSAHLKKIATPGIGTLSSSVGLLSREQAERTLTPPVMIRRDSVEKVYSPKTPPGQPSGTQDEPQTIQSPTAEPTPAKFDFQPKISADLVALEKVVPKTEAENASKEPTERKSQLLQFHPPPSLSSYTTNDSLLDTLTSFDDDDIDDKSDTDLVIVEPEEEKLIKKVKKTAKKSGATSTTSKASMNTKTNKSTNKSSTAATKASTTSSTDAADDNKKSIFMVAQVGDGTCIKIKMIKPIKTDDEAVKDPKPTKKAAKSSKVSSFEDALNSSSSVKKTKKSTGEKTNKTKSPRKKKGGEMQIDNGVETG